MGQPTGATLAPREQSAAATLRSGLRDRFFGNCPRSCRSQSHPMLRTTRSSAARAIAPETPSPSSAVLCALAPLPLCVNAVTASPPHTQTQFLAPWRRGPVAPLPCCLLALTRLQFAWPPEPVRQERRLRRYRSGSARKSRVRRTWSVWSHETCAIGVSSKL